MRSRVAKHRHSAFQAQKGLCFYCNQPMVSAKKKHHPNRCTAEHLRAKCVGGSDRASNIVAACWHCNHHRHAGKQHAPEPSEWKELMQATNKPSIDSVGTF
ncbi:HNH endonuclease [Comamonas sp. SY3]|uniref:HNH endonuclease n=1 Tax=Comamonas sp. SY3 TaxID=3243601 RepID=UPI003593D82B